MLNFLFVLFEEFLHVNLLALSTGCHSHFHNPLLLELLPLTSEIVITIEFLAPKEKYQWVDWLVL